MTIAALGAVLRSREAKAHVPDDAPVWEREHLQALQEAERAGNWARLGERAQAFKQLPRLDLGAREATLALSLLDWPRLVGLADRVEGWFHAHLLLEPLLLVDALRLATASRSGHVQFAVLERVANREMRDLRPHEETTLRNLLIVLAHYVDDWPSWLAVCNRYPVRHPHMQVALGRALARSGEHALHAYVDSISLSTSDSGIRECVTRCLSTFRAQAGTARRLALWRKILNRWKAWNFAATEGHELTSLARSALDYGVVGWLVESGPERSLADLERSFEADLRTLDMRWYASLSSAISGFFRLISRHQVLAHAASQSAEDPDWLPGPIVYSPAATTDVFIQQRYHWSNPEFS